MLRWIALVLILLLIGLQLKLWTGSGSMHEVDSLRVAVKKQTDENAKLLQRNQAVGADVLDLKHGDQAVEARARTELGLIKPGEVFYQVVEPPARAGVVVPPDPAARGNQDGFTGRRRDRLGRAGQATQAQRRRDGWAVQRDLPNSSSAVRTVVHDHCQAE